MLLMNTTNRTAAEYTRRETITSIETTITWFAAALNALSHKRGSITDAIRCHARAISA